MGFYLVIVGIGLKRIKEKEYMKLKILNPPRFELERVIEIYKAKISLLTIESPDIVVFNFEKFDADHEVLRYCSGLYKPDESLIYINHQCSTPLATLFHEFGHHLYQKILDKDQLHDWEKYYYRHYKTINWKLFRSKYENITKKVRFDCGEYGYIRALNTKQIYTLLFFHNVYQRECVFTKLESSYAPNKEEAFCETFASYMINGECLHKSNTKIMKGILESYENRTI